MLEVSAILHKNAESCTKFASNLTITCWCQGYLYIYPATRTKNRIRRETARGCRTGGYNGDLERRKYCRARNAPQPG